MINDIIEKIKIEKTIISKNSIIERKVLHKVPKSERRVQHKVPKMNLLLQIIIELQNKIFLATNSL
jgi:hypothetical protein